MTTSRQSRQENADLLQTFARVLLPLIKAYKGRLIKSIGDAYLVTFHSPTDAMLCSMALQDAMHGYNLNAIEEEKIHIRVAAHLGEVRVSKNDIFGEPVNVASRIEGVTPGDEIYLSEAVYMAMNKAEVPVVEVGEKQLDGVAQSVRLYCIPRFSVNRLVPEKRGESETGSELVYPYGGMHYYLAADSGFNMERLKSNQTVKLSMGLIGLFVLIMFSGWYFEIISFNTEDAYSVNSNSYNKGNNNLDKKSELTEGLIARGNNEQDESKQASGQESNELAGDSTEAPTTATNLAKNNTDEIQVEKEQPLQQVSELISNNVTEAKQIINEQITAKSTQAKELLTKTTVTKPAEVVKKSVVDSKPIPAKVIEKTPPVLWDVTKAKQAYRAETISKEEYSTIIRDLKLVYREKITQLKLNYRDKKITKAEYSAAVKIAKEEYSGD